MAGRVFPESGVGSESAVFESIKRWQRNNGTYVSDELIRRAMWEYWTRREPDRTTRLGPARAWDSRAGWKEKEGPRMWRRLHDRAAAVVRVGTIDAGAETGFLRQFQRDITCDECRLHWLGMIQKTPPDLTTPDSYFAWTVARHNETNKRLAKPVWTVQQARDEYV